MNNTIIIRDIKNRDSRDLSKEILEKISILDLKVDSLIIQLPVDMYFLEEDILEKLGDINIFTTNTMKESNEIIVRVKTRENFQIAIDGPSASGKSTIAKMVSEILGIDYLDTGAMYRAITYFLLQEKIDLNNEFEIGKTIDKIDFKYNSNNIVLNGKLLKDELRTELVTNNVSLVSSYGYVRERLVAIQRKIAQENSIVLDGRDIGTVVLPKAKYKFFLNATAEERARRRLKDNSSKLNLKYEEILEDIKRRDFLDSNREISPLKKSEDSIYIDSTELSICEVVEIILKSIRGI